MLTKIVLVLFLKAILVSLAEDGVTMNMATKDTEICSMNSLKNRIEEVTKQAVLYIGTQYNRGVKSTKQCMERSYFSSEEELTEIVEKIKKEYPVLAEKFKKINDMAREMDEISDEISKHILSGGKFQAFFDKAKDTLRPEGQ